MRIIPRYYDGWEAMDARAEAERRYPGWVNGTVPFPDGLEEARELAREYFIEGAEWAAGRAETTTDDATQRLARAAYAVDSKHHFHEGQDGRPTCSCGFVGDARKRTQTEHITAAVLEEYDHD